MPEHREVAAETVDRLRSICLVLPDVHEEVAWVGTRWRIGTKTFAHVVAIDGGWPPAYAAAAGTDGPATVLTFRASGDELDAVRAIGPPFFKPVWFDDIVGMVMDDRTDWTEVVELITDSYLCYAPKRLAGLVARPLPHRDDAATTVRRTR
jgi:hypothetical protein